MIIKIPSEIVGCIPVVYLFIVLKGAAISPGMHFHLAATINAATDIPLVPAMNSAGEAGGVHHTFSLHWLNNKEIYFSMEAEKILQELAKVPLNFTTELHLIFD